MANEIEIKIPDIGGAEKVDVIELLVQVGDKIIQETPLITLESDKASMEIPSPVSGTVEKILLKVGDKVSQGDLMLLVSSAQSNETPPIVEDEDKGKSKSPVSPEAKTITENVAVKEDIVVNIPDIGGSTDVDVIDILVRAGDFVEKEQSLVTLESDKATMDIPSPFAGTVKDVIIKLGEKVSQGNALLVLETSVVSLSSDVQAVAMPQVPNQLQVSPIKQTKEIIAPISTGIFGSSQIISAGPAVRRMARELGVDLAVVKGSGRKTRITKEDIQSYVKARLSEKTPVNGLNLPSGPIIDFTKFGEIEMKPMNKIKKLTGLSVHRSWVTIPHVTQFDEADITDLEAFRKSESENSQASGYKLTVLAFVCSVVSKALRAYPQFNASLDSTGEQLIYKKYCNIGIAVETPNGLVVPVIKNVDQLTITEIAIEMARLSTKARDKGLTPADMSGGCFTISSLGGIGGTAFTPIVNSPEVAILGLSRSVIKPVYEQDEFKPKLMLPLSLSYDHRVIDGAEAARFTRFIGNHLSDIRRILL